MRYFVALCETLNFTRAAERCNVSQPALSRAIARLEEELGGQLVRRERDRTHLTNLGRMMLPYFESVLRDVDRARRTADDFTALRDTPLRLALSRDLPASRLVAFFRRFQSEFPGVRLEIRDLEPDQVLAALLEDGIDVALHGGAQLDDPRLHPHPLYEEALCVALACDDALAVHPAIPARMLNGRRCHLPFAKQERQRVAHALSDAGVEATFVEGGARLDPCMALATDRIAVAILPEGCPHGPEVTLRPLVEPGLRRRVHAVTVAGRRHAPAVAALLQALRRHRWPGGSEPAPSFAWQCDGGPAGQGSVIDALWRAWRMASLAAGGVPSARGLAAATDRAALAAHLVQAEILEDGAEARYRAVGAEVCRRFGRDPTGRLVGETLPGEYRRHILDLNRQISRLGRPVYAESLYRWDCGAQAVTRRLFCPALDEAGRVAVGFSAQVFEAPDAGWRRAGPLLRSAGRMDVLRLEVLGA